MEGVSLTAESRAVRVNLKAYDSCLKGPTPQTSLRYSSLGGFTPEGKNACTNYARSFSFPQVVGS